MKSVKTNKNTQFSYLDHRIQEIYSREGVIILPSPEAWKKYKWTRTYFKTVPREGYFIWVTKSTNLPILIHIAALLPHVRQKLTNLLVVEKNIKARTESICQALAQGLRASHLSHGIIVLKKNAQLIYHDLHQWGNYDDVQPDYEYYLGDHAHLDYVYKSNQTPARLNIKTIVYAEKYARADIKVSIRSQKSHIKILDKALLKGKYSSAIIRLRLAAEQESQIEAYSNLQILKTADNAKGHLDCQGLLIAKDSEISLIPELQNSNPKALITHEASIGKVEGDELNYLRTRGLTEKEAIDLIVKGFLK